jgi:predicted lactoylglutathione lyase
MASQVFINLVVEGIDKSMELYTQMGFGNNPQFSDDNSKCMIWNESIYVMIMTSEKFKSFTSKPLADTKNSIAGIFSISVDSLERVNEIADKAIAAGAIEPTEMKDYGFMQLRSIEDFDGHTWEFFHMDMSKMPAEEI